MAIAYASVMKSVYFIALLATSGLLAACSHDAKRENPLDPELTPAVTLTLAVDGTLGTVTLTWTPYQGDAAFGSYLLLRNVFESTVVDTLDRFFRTDQTAYVDTTPVGSTGYVYRVSVISEQGLEAASVKQGIPPIELPGVDILGLRFDSVDATASLDWRPYSGPRFAAYEVQRTVGATTVIVVRLPDVSTTTFTDSLLVGGTDYSYQVSVLTSGGEVLLGESVSGSFHRHVASWPLPVSGDKSAFDEFVRLYSEDDGIVALVSSEKASSRALLYDHNGILQQTRTLGDLNRRNARFPSSILTPGGDRVSVSVGESNRHVGLHRLAEDGLPITQKRVLFDAKIPSPLGEEQGVVTGEIEFASVSGAAGLLLGNVVVSSAGQILLQEDFAFLTDGIDLAGATTTINDWTFAPSSAAGRASVRPTILGIDIFQASARRVDPSWRSYTLDVDLASQQEGYSGTVAKLSIGGDTYSRFTLLIDYASDVIRLHWVYKPPNESDPTLEMTFEEDFPDPTRLPYHVTLGVEDDRFHAAIEHSVWVLVEVPDQIWSSLASLGEQLALTAQDQLFVIGDDGAANHIATLDGAVSETRTWRVEGDPNERIGVSLPGENQVRWGTVVRESRWDLALNHQVGPGLGAAGSLYHPVSLAGSPDGRVYVLDAGNARVVVFDADGNFITHWGTSGSLDGQFDFGHGTQVVGGPSFAGSIAVDDDGFIYVADVGNNRIQKFAP
jgi:hypothetical protein